MREFKIFIIVVFFTALVYWGVEPFAHSILKPHTSAANFDFAQEDISYAKEVLKLKQNELNIAKKDLENAKNSNNEEIILANEIKLKVVQNALENAKNSLEANQALWDRVAKIDLNSGDAARGKVFIAEFGGLCISCHGIAADDIPAPITDSSTGVLPPDLSSSGIIYDDKFLAALILNPALALKVEHKNTLTMPPYEAEDEAQTHKDIADIIAYLKEVAQKDETKFLKDKKLELENSYAKLNLNEKDKNDLIAKDLLFAQQKRQFIDACARCHDLKYDGIKMLSSPNELKSYLGSIPPDLSMYIRSRGIEYLHNFVNNTQKLLNGTAMPRVGLNEKAQDNVISYMEKVGDSKKDQRQSIGLYMMGFFFILSIFAYLWKRKIWANLH